MGNKMMYFRRTNSMATALTRSNTRPQSLLLFLVVLSFTILCLRAGAQQAFFEKHCTDCHDADERKGGLDLTALKKDFTKAESFALWVKVHDAIASGEMPPKKKARPAAAESAAFLGSLGKELTDAEGRASKAGGGRTTVRRMNRTEYEHALRDVLALPLLRVKELLPEDGQQFGFDKVAGALDISHVQMTKYLQTADTALRQAVVKTLVRPDLVKWREPAAEQDTMRGAIATHNAVPLMGRELAPGLTTHVVGNPQDDYGNTYRGATFDGKADSAAVLTGVIGAHQPEGVQMDHFRPTVPGWYRVRFSIWSLRWERTKAVPAVRNLVQNFDIFGPPYFKNAAGRWEFTRLPQEKPGEGRMENVEFYGATEATHIIRASLNGVPLGYFDAPSLQPKTHEFKVWLNPGERISFHAMTLPASAAQNGGQSEGVRSYIGPAVAYDWFEAEGPLVEQWPPESQRRLFGETPVAAYPRPMLAGAPVVEAGATTKLPLADFKGPGQMLGHERYLNIKGTVTTTVNCPVPGDYEFAVTAYETHAGNEAAQMYLMLGDNEMPHARFSVDAKRGAAKKYSAKFRVESPGPVTVGVQFTNDFIDETQANPFEHDRNLYFTNIEVTAPQRPADTLATKPADHRSLLLGFATRAFRRPVAEEEVKPFAAIVEGQLARGVSYEEAMLAGYKALLCAPDFLFIGLESGVPKPDAPRLGDHALASRLSFFLWNSGPDETLLVLAARNMLSQPATLRTQVERMLADARSERFIEHFLDEWLELKKMDFTTPDPNLYPEFDPWLRDSMLAESRAWFRKLLTQNLGVSHLVASDTLLINQRLAELYGIRGVAGAELRGVPSAGTQRGGFLTQAAVLKVTANGTATSPVLRGVWVMERLLGIPRDPPPPNIPAVEPDATGAVTIRQMIEKHRADSACASCHAKMDPPGMALESFDVIGGYRDRYRLAGTPKQDEPSVLVVSATTDNYRSRMKLRLGSEVDASGELADGRTFADLNGYRALLLKDEDALARNVARQFLIYATGTGIRFSDRPAIEAIVAKTKASHHGIRSLVQEVVTSALFQTK